MKMNNKMRRCIRVDYVSTNGEKRHYFAVGVTLGKAIELLRRAGAIVTDWNVNADMAMAMG